MNPQLTALFLNASKSCRDANPDVPGHSVKKTCSTGTRDAIRAILNHDEDTNNGPVSNSKFKHHQTPALGGAVQGKAKSLCRVRVRFTGYRVRPLDPDNFAGSCKDLLDGLRHAGLLLGDEPWRIIYETEQEKVKTYAHERTLIEIEYP